MLPLHSHGRQKSPTELGKKGIFYTVKKKHPKGQITFPPKKPRSALISPDVPYSNGKFMALSPPFLSSLSSFDFFPALNSTARISHCYTLRCLRSSKSREDVNQSTDDANLRQSRRDKMNVKIGSMSIHLINDDANFDPKRGSSNSGHAAAQARLAYNNDGSTRYSHQSAVYLRKAGLSFPPFARCRLSMRLLSQKTESKKKKVEGAMFPRA